MVSKRCVYCGSYFQGDWNGIYLCESCGQAGPVPLRPLSSLDGLDALAPTTPPAFEPERARTSPQPKARSHAA